MCAGPLPDGGLRPVQQPAVRPGRGRQEEAARAAAAGARADQRCCRILPVFGGAQAEGGDAGEVGQHDQPGRVLGQVRCGPSCGQDHGGGPQQEACHAPGQDSTRLLHVILQVQEDREASAQVLQDLPGASVRCKPGEYRRGTYFCAACQTNALGGGPTRNRAGHRRAPAGSACCTSTPPLSSPPSRSSASRPRSTRT